MTYKRIEFHTRSGKTVSFRARVKARTRARKTECRPKTLAKTRPRRKASLHSWGYGRVT